MATPAQAEPAAAAPDNTGAIDTAATAIGAAPATTSDPDAATSASLAEDDHDAEAEAEAEAASYVASGTATPGANGTFPPLSQEEEAAFLSWAQAHQSGFVPEDAEAAARREEEAEAMRIRREEEERQRAARENRRKEREEKKALAAQREAAAQQQQLAQQQAAAASASAARISQRSRTSARQANSPARGGGGAMLDAPAAAPGDPSSNATSPVRASRAPLSPSIPEPFSSLSALAPADSRSRLLPIGAGLLAASASSGTLAPPRVRGPSQERLPIELKDRKWLSNQHDIAAQNAFLLGRLLAIGQGSAAYYDSSHGMKGGAGAFVPPKSHASDPAHRKNGWDDDARDMLASRRRILIQNAQFKRRRTQAKIDRENAIIQDRLLKAKHSQAIDPSNHRKSYAMHQHYRELRSHYRVAPSADNAFAEGAGPSLALEAAQALASKDNPAATRYTAEQTRQLYTSLSAPNLHGGAQASDPHAAERTEQLMRELDAQDAEQQQNHPEEKTAGSSPSKSQRRPGSGTGSGPKNFRAAGGHAYALTPQSIQELMEHVFFAQQEAQAQASQQRRAQTGQRLKPLPAASRSYPQSALGPGLLNGSLSPLANLRSLSPIKNAGASKALQAAALRRAARGGAPESAPARARPAAAAASDSPYAKHSSASSSTRSHASASTAAPSDRSLARHQHTAGEIAGQLTAAMGAGQQATLERDLARQARRSAGEEKEEAAHLLSPADQARVDTQIADANSAATDTHRHPLPHGRAPSTFGSGPEDLLDLDGEEAAEEEDGFDDAKCLTTPLNVKSLSQFMRPVNASKKEYSEEELNQ